MKTIMKNWNIFLNEQKLPNNYHIIKKGDTLWKISRKYKIPFDKLMSLNPKFQKFPRNKNLIYVGEKVWLKKKDKIIDPDPPPVLEDLWITISDYVDELISSNSKRIKGYLKQILIQINIVELNNKNKSATKKMKTVTLQSLKQEYRDMLIYFGPSSSPISVLGRRNKLNVLDPLKSETFREALRSIDIVEMKVYENILLYYFIAKVGQITGFTPPVKYIDSAMSISYEKINDIFKENEGPVMGTELYKQISMISQGSLKAEVESEVDSYISKNRNYFSTRKPLPRRQ